MNRHIVFAGAAALALAAAGSASAASFPAPAYNWTGAYVGAHVGYGWGREDWTQTTSSLTLPLDRSIEDVKLDGVTGGLQAGYDYASGPWVIGVAADGSLNDQEGVAGHTVFTSYDGRTQNDWTVTLSARGGYATGHVLLYVLGGVAFAHDKSVIRFDAADTTDEVSDTRAGWLAGAGIEKALTRHWTAGLEYNYTGYGKHSATFTYFAHPAGLVEGWDLRQDNHLLKATLNYRFGMH